MSVTNVKNMQNKCEKRQPDAENNSQKYIINEAVFKSGILPAFVND